MRALFALLVPFTGLSRTTAEIGLVSFTLLILVRNIVAGLDGVPEEVREAMSFHFAMTVDEVLAVALEPAPLRQAA